MHIVHFVIVALIIGVVYLINCDFGSHWQHGYKTIQFNCQKFLVCIN